MKLIKESNRQPSQSAQKISPAPGTPGKHVMKFLLQSGKPAQERDYASSCLTAPVLTALGVNTNALAGEMHSAEQLSVPVRLHTKLSANQTLQVSSAEKGGCAEGMGLVVGLFHR